MKIFLSLILAAALLPAQVADKANSGYKTKEGRDRVANSLDAPNRDATEHPEDLVAHLSLSQGMTVADVGTGTGYMLPFLSKAVGSAGKVLGEDIQTDFLDRAKAKIDADKLTNVELVLGTDRTPKLPDAAVNVVLILDAYHHFDYPAEMLSAIRRSLKPGGHLVIVDYYKNAGPGPGHIRLDRDDVAKEIQSNGFHLLSNRDHLPNVQYMLTFEAR